MIDTWHEQIADVQAPAEAHCRRTMPSRWPARRCHDGSKRPWRSRHVGHGFTIIELLVVISIVSLIMALLLPALSGARESARRVVCASNLHQFGVFAYSYAMDHQHHFPSGHRDAGSSEHTRDISSELYEIMQDRAGTPEALSCPNREPWFRASLGWHLGFSYLGNHATPFPGPNGDWVSPRKSSDPPDLALVVDHTERYFSVIPGNQFCATVPHTGQGDQFVRFMTSWPQMNALGAQGGNVGLVDGSVQWRPISEMTPHSSASGTANYEVFW